VQLHWQSHCYLNAYFESLTADLSVAPGLNAGDFDAAIFSSAPVAGLRPVRAARSRTSNEPKPTNDMSSPAVSVSVTTSINAAKFRAASALVLPVFVASASISSLRLIF
jgi:hypothetical protein